jgi:protein-tyrosine phosphatase
MDVVVDLHCHLLPAVDDGAQDLGDAIAMALQAEADGIAAICATPHIRHDHDVRIAELPQRRADLQKAILDAGCATRVLAGAEVATTAVAGLDEGQLQVLTLGGGGRWILLEPPPGPLDDRLERAVADLRARGLGAVIAHPERHLAADLIERLQQLVSDYGALVQGTGAFLLHESTQPGMFALAQAGVLHVLGSDAHSSRAGRPVALAQAVQALATVPRCSPHLDWIAHTAPSAIAAGRPVSPPF